MSTPVTAAAEPHLLSRMLRQVGVDTGYLLLGLPLAILSLVILITGFALGVGLLAIVIGLAVLGVTLRIARGLADIERARLRTVLNRPELAQPVYRKTTSSRWFGRVVDPVIRGQYWLDLAHGIFTLIPSTIAFSIAVTWWAAVLDGATYWYWGRFIPRDGENPVVKFVMGADTPANEQLMHAGFGLFALVTLPFVLRAMALFRAGFARVLLTSAAETQQKIDVLTRGRAAAVAAEATALRKLERDIHDGPQQRLVRLAMDLSRAQRQVDRDPAKARETLTEALAQTRETLDELRALSRGIAPPILADRGLSAALSAVASRCTVPVDLSTEVEGRLPANVENTAYFVVAEALANIAKHSGASAAKVTVSSRDGLLYLVVEDNGVGGASIAKGHGLAGLADRVRATDGAFAVDSPAGGPTVVVAELPCA